jgi:hypothetical protein
VVEVVRDAVLAFFPSLPVDQMPVSKMFAVFGWLNDVSQQINQKYAPEETGEGNGAGETSSQS